jgi:uncharacterized protein (TIGR02302 family)
MAENRDSNSALDAKFLRKVRASRWALLFERLWPRLWLILGVGGLFLFVSLVGLWPMLPQVLHVALLGAFVLAGIAAIVYAARVPFPTHEEGVRRIERVSGVPHRPASSYEDTVTANADDPRTSAIWRAHRARLAAALSRLRVGKPHPRADRADPIALRALLLLGVFAVAALVGDGAADRLRSAFRFPASSSVADRRLDAWVTPPTYTGRPPLMLADGAHGSLAPASDTKVVQVPAKSVLIVRTSGSGLGNIGLEVLSEGATETEKVEAKAPEAGKGVHTGAKISELRYDLEKPAEVRVMSSGTQIASWVFNVIPDNAPKIALKNPPEQTQRGSLKLSYTVEDDYGVVAAEAKLKRTNSEDKKDPAKAWARTNALTGPRPPHERPPQLILRLPPGSSTKEAQTYIDFGPHPYAGREVMLTLEARDVAGNIGRSEPMRMVLPKRRFKKPLARALVEQRAKLLDDPRYRPQVLRALEALTVEPEGFIDSTAVYLGLRTTYYNLGRDTSREGLKGVTDGLWDLALWIEDGDLSDAERALREAQDKLADALEKGAPDSEIDALMRELREALNRYVEQLTKNASKDQMQPPEGLDPNNQMLSQQDLERMMKELENMTRSGSREQAQQMLAEMRDLLERLQSGQMSQQEAQRGQMMMKKLDELGNLVGQQQRLMDDTYKQQREGQRPGGAMPGGRGDREAQGQGQRGRQGQSGKSGQAGQQGQGGGQQPGQQALSEQQRQLKEELEKLRRSLDEMGANSPELDGAREAMENAERSLQQGDMNSALGEQQSALQQMREGADKMAEGMQKGGASRYGQNGDMQRDPMGRPQRFQGPDAGNSVKVPDEIDIQRARAILEELRRRLAQPTRPPVELDYFERLLRRF